MSKAGPGELPAYLLHLATLQLLCRAAPFTHARTLPLHTLSDLAADYIHLLATAAKSNAELAGRNQTTIWDLGRALEEFGTGTLGELRDEMEKGGGGTEEGLRLRSIAGGLKDVLDVPAPPEPVARLNYDPLTPAELAAIADLREQEPPDHSEGSDSSDDDDDIFQTPSSSASPPPIRIKVEESHFDLLALIHDAASPSQPDLGEHLSAWRDPSLIPSYVPEFLPPFPGMEKESDIPEHVRRRRDREREREALAAAWAEGRDVEDRDGVSGSQDPWVAAVPYEASIIRDMNLSTTLPNLSPPTSPTSRRRRRPRSLSPSTTSSLNSFRLTARDFEATRESNIAPSWLRPNPKRRAAAATITVSSDASLYNDSLFGSIPVPLGRSAALTPGFLPDLAPPKIHPFNTNLPHTIATPVPPHPSPHAALMAPPSHPRIPSLIGKMASQLSQPTSPHLQLFNRLTRMGPPGPLGSKGEALDYEYVGQTSLIASNVEWPTRDFHLPLSTREKDDGTETGIKLTLGRGTGPRTGSAPVSAMGSPAAGMGFTPGPQGFTPGPSGATPGPSWLQRSASPAGHLRDGLERGSHFFGSPSAMSPVVEPMVEVKQEPASEGFGEMSMNGLEGVPPIGSREVTMDQIDQISASIEDAFARLASPLTTGLD